MYCAINAPGNRNKVLDVINATDKYNFRCVFIYKKHYTRKEWTLYGSFLQNLEIGQKLKKQ